MSFRMFPLWVALGSLSCIPLEAASTAFACAFQTSPQTDRAGQAKKPSTAQDSAQKAPTNARQSTEEILNNDSIIELLKIGLSEELIIAKVRQSEHKFDLSVPGLKALKQAGASDRLIAFLMDPTKPLEPKAEPPGPPVSAPPAGGEKAKDQQTVPQPSTGANPANSPTSSLPTEVGVYVRKDNHWIDIQPEVVNWETGVVLKHIASAGVVKGDVNGRINGVHSRNAVKTPLEFLIVVLEGVAITEYQLIHLLEQSDARELRTVTRGGFHVSGGATRDLLQFEGEEVP